jgi:N-acetyltransferase
VITDLEAIPVVSGERVRLRPARDSDASDFVRWAAVPEFAWMQWGRSPGRFPDPDAAAAFMARFVEPDGRLFVIEHGGRPVGFANYRDWRAKPRSAEVGIGIGEPELWSQGLGRDALTALVRHLVDDLGAHRITLHVMAFNDRAIASYKACGFRVEGRLVDAVLTDRETYEDSVEMAYVVGQPAPPFDPRPVTLRGRHVVLEPLRMAHAPALYEAVKEPDIWTWLNVGPPASVADMERYVRDALDLQIRGEHLPWLTRRAGDGAVIGTTRYGAIDPAARSVEIGWTMLSASARRTAANTEAKLLQLRHAFEELGAVRVWLKTDVLNERSRRAIERIGGKLDGIIRNERFTRNGRIRDASYYSFIDREWAEAKRHLEALLARP